VARGHYDRRRGKHLPLVGCIRHGEGWGKGESMPPKRAVEARRSERLRFPASQLCIILRGEGAHITFLGALFALLAATAPAAYAAITPTADYTSMRSSRIRRSRRHPTPTRSRTSPSPRREESVKALRPFRCPSLRLGSSSSARCCFSTSGRCAAEHRATE
jgi:hypothetical protein